MAFTDEDQQYIRVWISPDLANPDILQLVKLFSAFAFRRPFPRFPVPQANSSGHVNNEGDDDGLEGHIRFGIHVCQFETAQRRLRLGRWMLYTICHVVEAIFLLNFSLTGYLYPPVTL